MHAIRGAGSAGTRPPRVEPDGGRSCAGERPGWRYSESLGQVEGTEMCEAEHRLWMMISGRRTVRMADPTTKEFGPREVGSIPPGARGVVGRGDPVVAFDVQPGGGDGRRRAATPPATD
jgi:hypothetical protein